MFTSQETDTTRRTPELCWNKTLLTGSINVAENWARGPARSFRLDDMSDAEKSPMPKYKRLLDVVLAVTVSVLLLPVFLLTALAVSLTSQGPILFRQTRIGLDGRPFKMLKFRSMHVDADQRRAELLQNSERSGLCFKMKNDPRLTPIGAMLRRFSIDELPQLWNVLRGEMSIVGPRPALPEEVAAYSTRAMQRLNAVPGITGIWQVSGRAEIDFDTMVEMDVTYIRTKNFWLDVSLIGRTVGAVLNTRGAY